MSIINLLPAELREQQRYAFYNRRLVNLATSFGISSLILLLALALQLVILGQQKSLADRSLSSGKAQLAGLADVQAQAQNNSTKLNLLATARQDHIAWDKLFEGLSARTPSGIYLTGIQTSPPPDRSVSISGAARDSNQVASFLAALSGWGALASPSVQTISPDSDQVGFSHYVFTINATLVPAQLQADLPTIDLNALLSPTQSGKKGGS